MILYLEYRTTHWDKPTSCSQKKKKSLYAFLKMLWHSLVVFFLIFYRVWPISSMKQAKEKAVWGNYGISSPGWLLAFSVDETLLFMDKACVKFPTGGMYTTWVQVLLQSTNTTFFRKEIPETQKKSLDTKSEHKKSMKVTLKKSDSFQLDFVC